MSGVLDAEFAVAIGALQRGQKDEAAAQCERILRTQPDHVDALHLSAHIALQAGRVADAILRLERAVAAAPGATVLRNDLGAAYRFAGRDREAEAAFEAVIAAEPDNANAWHNLGMTRRALGALGAAETALRRAIALVPAAPPHTHTGLGMVLDGLGRYGEAADAFRAALAQQPDSPDALNNLALALDKAGAGDEAAALIARAVVLAPERAALAVNQAVIAQHRGALDEALAAADRALALDPKAAGAWRVRGLVRARRDDPHGAAEAFERALALAPDDAEAIRSLAAARLKTGDHARAVAMLDGLVTRRPGNAEAWTDLAVARRESGDPAGALTAVERALALAPAAPDALHTLGALRTQRGDQQGAAEAFARAIAAAPDRANYHGDLAAALFNLRRLDEAAAAAERAVALDDTLAGAFMNLGAVRNSQGRLVEAEAALRRALALDPALAQARSNLLFSLNYRDDVDDDALRAEHREWGRHHGEPPRAAWQPHDNARDPERRIVVGFVSADFNRHPVGFFVRRLFENLDRAAIEPVCFAAGGASDDLTAALRAAVPRWIDAAALDDAALAARVRAERVDILIDLAGHTAGNRLLAFARKPAPVQMTWAGYVGTTGLAAIDWLIADRFHVPEGWEGDIVERVLRLPDGYVCYAPPDYAPAVTALPAASRGHVTFAGFHNPAKIGPRAIALWARAMQAVPGSRLLLKYKGIDAAANRDRLLAGFAAAGIAADRLRLEGVSPHHELLARYGETDIALDSLPYSGGVTTLEALWMGVPVVTLPGRRFASRHSLSHLANAGLPELAATDDDGFVAIVRGLAGDLGRLAALRASLRARMAAAPVCDGPRFAASFAAGLRDAWRGWCAGR